MKIRRNEAILGFMAAFAASAGTSHWAIGKIAMAKQYYLALCAIATLYMMGWMWHKRRQRLANEGKMVEA